ncbi:hypothetical protein SAMN06272789_0716 [Streptomyces sp. 1331.2]|nr:hypothetical protein SAMN06272789_0716 [Streptomyces sp. 1331.2]
MAEPEPAGLAVAVEQVLVQERPGQPQHGALVEAEGVGELGERDAAPVGVVADVAEDGECAAQ